MAAPQKKSPENHKYDFLRCPNCSYKDKGELTKDVYHFECIDCGNKYPIKSGIPIMLLVEDDFLNILSDF